MSGWIAFGVLWLACGLQTMELHRQELDISGHKQRVSQTILALCFGGVFVTLSAIIALRDRWQRRNPVEAKADE